MEASRVATEVYARPSDEQAEQAIELIDQIITEIYLPFRGAPGYQTERAILVEPSHAPHRENDAEHSWHLAFTVRMLWDNCEALGLAFPSGFSIERAKDLALIHDIPEIWADDVDATTPDLNLLYQKAEKDKAAIFLMRRSYPFMGEAAKALLRYEEKDTPEAQFVSDIDKIIGTRMICLDGGNKWLSHRVSRELMCERMRQKIRTENGHALFDALERDLDNHPEYFPAEKPPIPLPGGIFVQDTLF